MMSKTRGWLGLSALALLGALGCADDGGKPGVQAGSAGTGGAAGSTTSAGGSGASGQHAGGGGSGGQSGGQAGGKGGADMGPPVPRVENTDGTSVLDEPSQSLSDGKCMAGAVLCGECLATEGQTAGSCTALKLGLGQTTSLALTADALFYTASNEEILKLDLAAGTHSSLVRGLTFVQALVVEGDALYFSTLTPDSFFEYDVRRVALGGGDVTVLSPQQSQEIGAIIPLPDRLLIGVGTFEYDLFTIPTSGGPTIAFGGITRATTPVLGGTTLYYRSDDGVCSTSIDTPAPDNALNGEFSNARLILEGDYLYYAIDGIYTRTPVAGGTPEEVQPLEGGVWGRTTDRVIFTQTDAADEQLVHLFAMPIAGGTPTELVTLEYGELQAIAGNATDLYLAVGSLHGGALLRIAL